EPAGAAGVAALDLEAERAETVGHEGARARGLLQRLEVDHLPVGGGRRQARGQLVAELLLVAGDHHEVERGRARSGVAEQANLVELEAGRPLADPRNSEPVGPCTSTDQGQAIFSSACRLVIVRSSIGTRAETYQVRRGGAAP